jgi:hypothetical protein
VVLNDLLAHYVIIGDYLHLSQPLVEQGADYLFISYARERNLLRINLNDNTATRFIFE